MQFTLATAAFLLLAALHSAVGTFIVTTGSVALSTSAAALAALKLSAVGGAILGSAIGSRRRYRGKRELVQCLPVANTELYFTLAANSDKLGCVQRFVCEVSARDAADLTEDERLIRDAFASNLTAEAGSAKSLFVRAASIGAKGEPRLCVDEYSKCPIDGKTLLKEFIRAQQQ
ncbi:uncharacterized protein LOC122244863 [Penaeus japonicus]|uniref:uncharacterized protein LOC122244863 n=1 Tax=Penaeus japonicus TaxID=27405 RepID=UPI001C716EA9|nr:uncharacterized protein LOC122244863 [Penaeus japonicus]